MTYCHSQRKEQTGKTSKTTIISGEMFVVIP